MAKRSSIRITKSVVDALGPGEDAWDSEVKGFGVRCQTKGRSYVLKTTINRRQKWITIGRHGSPWTPTTARAKALELLGQTVKGEDPTKPTEPEAIKVRELCERYIRQYAIPEKKASTVRLDRKSIANHINPLIGEKLVHELQSKDITNLKDWVYTGKMAPKDPKQQQKDQGGGRVVTGGPHVANHCLKILSKMMNLAELWGLRPKGTNPVKGVSLFSSKPKQRYLIESELKKLGLILAQLESEQVISIYVSAAIRLLILTGARLNEILTLKWDYINFPEGYLHLVDSKTGPKSIFLPPPAITILRKLPRFADNPYVIRGRKPGRHLVDIFTSWCRIREAAGIPDVRIHDLRHSFASQAIQNGIPLGAVGKLLGHKNNRTTERYAHYEDAYLAAQSDKIGQLLSAAMTVKEDQPDRNESSAADSDAAD